LSKNNNNELKHFYNVLPSTSGLVRKCELCEKKLTFSKGIGTMEKKTDYDNIFDKKNTIKKKTKIHEV